MGREWIRRLYVPGVALVLGTGAGVGLGLAEDEKSAMPDYASPATHLTLDHDPPELHDMVNSADHIVVAQVSQLLATQEPSDRGVAYTLVEVEVDRVLTGAAQPGERLSVVEWSLYGTLDGDGSVVNGMVPGVDYLLFLSESDLRSMGLARDQLQVYAEPYGMLVGSEIGFLPVGGAEFLPPLVTEDDVARARDFVEPTIEGSADETDLLNARLNVVCDSILNGAAGLDDKREELSSAFEIESLPTQELLDHTGRDMRTLADAIGDVSATHRVLRRSALAAGYYLHRAATLVEGARSSQAPWQDLAIAETYALDALHSFGSYGASKCWSAGRD